MVFPVLIIMIVIQRVPLLIAAAAWTVDLFVFAVHHYAIDKWTFINFSTFRMNVLRSCSPPSSSVHCAFAAKYDCLLIDTRHHHKCATLFDYYFVVAAELLIC